MDATIEISMAPSTCFSWFQIEFVFIIIKYLNSEDVSMMFYISMNVIFKDPGLLAISKEERRKIHLILRSNMEATNMLINKKVVV